MVLFQSTLPVRGATGYRRHTRRLPAISIHAPRAGSDMVSTRHPSRRMDFNPRSPCGERREPALVGPFAVRFQSTLPVWGATLTWCSAWLTRRRFQSTLPVRGATGTHCCKGEQPHISIHAPRAGSDSPLVSSSCDGSEFQSTLPVRGATTRPSQPRTLFTFQSTLPVRGATPMFPVFPHVFDFNPRSPCGERPPACASPVTMP